MSVSVIIGSNYGDEGKGAAVWESAKDFLRKGSQPIVVRFNGGPQAGHTVQLGPHGGSLGIRHVHSSYGSATLLGCCTGYTSDAMVSPGAIVREAAALRKHLKALAYSDFEIADILQIRLDNHTKVVTPFDAALGQFVERKKRHGSVGMGIGEAMRRQEESVPFSAMRMFQDKRSLTSKLVELEEYFRAQLKVLKENDLVEDVPSIRTPAAIDALCEFIRADFTSSVEAMIQSNLAAVGDFDWMDEAEAVVFEGAQGLLLDQDNDEHFPHVTWSKTGAANVLKELEEKYPLIPSDELEIFYCTRPYLTRHGAGPMLAGLGEAHGTPEAAGLIGFSDATNVPNAWQGSLRFQQMDWTKFLARIDSDFAHFRQAYPKCRGYVSVSCVDHLPDWHKVRSNVIDMCMTRQSGNRWPLIEIDGRTLTLPPVGE